MAGRPHGAGAGRPRLLPPPHGSPQAAVPLPEQAPLVNHKTFRGSVLPQPANFKAQPPCSLPAEDALGESQHPALGFEGKINDLKHIFHLQHCD